MSNTATEYANEVKKDVLFLLANEMLTTRQLEARLQMSYPTIRRAIVELEEAGQITKFDRRNRNARYTLAPANEGQRTLVPRIIFKGHSVSLTQVYRDQGIEDVAVRAADAILKAWTTIATTANRLANGVPDTILVKQLNVQKVHLANARMDLEQLVFLINQMLDNEKLWTMENLVNFSDDPLWKDFQTNLDDLYAKYYGGDDDA